MSIQPWHKRIARVLAAALLFTQCAMTAHACQMAFAAATDTAAMAAAVAAPAPMAQGGCGHMHDTPAVDDNVPPDTSADPTLCKAHCEPGQPSVGAKLQIDASSMAAVCVAIVSWPILVVPPPVVATRFTRDAGPPPGTPPLYIAYAVLRR